MAEQDTTNTGTNERPKNQFCWSGGWIRLKGYACDVCYFHSCTSITAPLYAICIYLICTEQKQARNTISFLTFAIGVPSPPILGS